MSTVIPTLGDQLFLTEPNVQLSYVIRTFSIFPANTMPFLNSSMPSLAALAAQFGYDGPLLMSKIQNALQTLLRSTFPTGNPTVDVSQTTGSDYTVNGTLNLTIKVTLDLAGNVHTAAGVATIRNGMVTIPNDEVSLT